MNIDDDIEDDRTHTYGRLVFFNSRGTHTQSEGRSVGMSMFSSKPALFLYKISYSPNLFL